MPSTDFSLSQSKRRRNDKQSSEVTWFLFYFQPDSTYTLITEHNSAWAGFPKEDRLALGKGEVVTLYHSNKPYKALLLKKGKDYGKLLEKLKVLEGKIEDAHRNQRSIEVREDASFLESTQDFNENLSDEADLADRGDTRTPGGRSCDSEKRSSLNSVSTRPPVDEMPDQVSESDSESESEPEQATVSVSGSEDVSINGLLKENVRVLKSLKTALDRSRRENKRLRKILNQRTSGGSPCCRQSPSQLPAGAKVTWKVHGKEIDLLQLTGGSASKYGLKVAKTIFTPKELMTGILSPQKMSDKAALSPNRKLVLKKCVEHWFPGQWGDVRESVNQMGRDARRKEGKPKRCLFNREKENEADFTTNLPNVLEENQSQIQFAKK